MVKSTYIRSSFHCNYYPQKNLGAIKDKTFQTINRRNFSLQQCNEKLARIDRLKLKHTKSQPLSSNFFTNNLNLPLIANGKSRLGTIIHIKLKRNSKNSEQINNQRSSINFIKNEKYKMLDERNNNSLIVHNEPNLADHL